MNKKEQDYRVYIDVVNLAFSQLRIYSNIGNALVALDTFFAKTLNIDGIIEVKDLNRLNTPKRLIVGWVVNHHSRNLFKGIFW